MHDGIHVENAGTPSVTICTDAFIDTSKSMAAMWGTPAYPTIFTPHPIAGLSQAQLHANAEEVIDRVVTILTGN